MAFTFFFRDRQTLNLIQEHVVPAIKTRRYIRIWDAGCAMGPEPYSLAMLMREKMGRYIFRNVKILATDIDISNRFGKIIKEGIYTTEVVHRIPKPMYRKYFSPVGHMAGHFVIADEIRRSVEFLKHDLLSLQPPRDDFSLVVCKNVLLHLKAKERTQVVQMFHAALDGIGFFVTERTQKMPEKLTRKFENMVTNAQLFRKM